MTPEEYEDMTSETAVYPGKDTGSLAAVIYCALGLGEAGEVQGKLKKVLRGDVSLSEQREGLLDELGDTLWYVTRLANELGLSIRDLMVWNAAKLRARQARGTIKGSGDER